VLLGVKCLREVIMKHIVPTVLVSPAVSIGVFAQGRRGAPPAPPLEAGASQVDVDKALIALPEGLRNQTTVIKWKADFTYDTLRKAPTVWSATTARACQPFAVQCTSLGNLPREA
jgi:hypothetical protein